MEQVRLEMQHLASCFIVDQASLRTPFVLLQYTGVTRYVYTHKRRYGYNVTSSRCYPDTGMSGHCVWPFLDIG